ncbi:MAG: hypothetical protein QOD67_3895 [Caballeronia sp.]|nr:hypothetical protein [Caballeronia sp.]
MCMPIAVRFAVLEHAGFSAQRIGRVCKRVSIATPQNEPVVVSVGY